MTNINARMLVKTFVLFVLTVFPICAAFAQSTDPDAPTVLTEGIIEGMNSSRLSEDNTYYYEFNVDKGTMSLTLDLIPTNRSDGGGLLQWKLLNSKFEKLKDDVLSASSSPERQMKDMPVTIKRRIILKIVVAGNVGYKIKLTGSAVKFNGTK